jgi:hypothetical protein
MPREASRAQKSPCPAITSSSVSTSPSICLKVLDMFSTEGVNFSALAPIELKTFFNRCTQRLPKFRHMSRSSFKDCFSFVFSVASASYFVCKFFLSCSKLSNFCRSSLFSADYLRPGTVTNTSQGLFIDSTKEHGSWLVATGNAILL